MTTAIAITVGFGVFAASFVIMLLFLTYRSATFGASLVMLLLALETIYVILPALRLGLNVYPQDLVFGVLAIAAVVRVVEQRLISIISRLWILFGLIIFANFGLGLPQYGTAAGLDFREYFYFYVGTIYFFSFPYSNESFGRLINVWLWGGFAICSIAVYRWIMIGSGLETYAWLDTTGIAGRVISSAPTLTLTGCLVMLVFAASRGTSSRGWIPLLPIVFAVIVGSQQRTVWIATMAALPLAMLKAGNARGRAFVTIVAVSVVIGAVATLFLGTGVGQDAGASIREAARAGASTTSGTFVGRVAGWKELLKEYVAYPPYQLLVGKPFGAGYTRWEGTQEVGFTPHSYYVQTLLRSGAVGLFALLGTYFLLLRGFSRQENQAYAAQGDLLWVLLALQGVYCVTYGIHFEQSIVLGAAMALAAATRRTVSADRTQHVAVA